MDKKIVFFDIDGTLYDLANGIPVPESTRAAISGMQKNGHLAVLCTGRTISELEPELCEIRFDGIISGCGTYIEYREKELFYETVDNGIFRRVVEHSRAHHALPFLEGRYHVYFDPAGEDEEARRISRDYETLVADRVRPITGQVWEASKVTIQLRKDWMAEKEQLMQAVAADLDVIDHGHALECVPRGFSKASGIALLIERLGIKRENTYAFGDSANDKEMLTFVEYGIAMGNSSEEILSISRYRTDRLTEDGIYNACRRFGLIG